MTFKDWLIVALGAGCIIGAAYYVKHRSDIEEIEGSIFNPEEISFEPIE